MKNMQYVYFAELNKSLIKNAPKSMKMTMIDK